MRGLIGREIDRRSSLRGACVVFGLSLLLVAAGFLPRLWGGPDAQVWLQLWLLAALVAIPGVIFAATALLLWLPASSRGLAQPLLILAIASGLGLVLYLPAGQVAPITELTDDQWPLAVVLFVLALALGGFLLHRQFPMRGFLFFAGLAFCMILPDFMGLYVELLDSSRVTRGHVVHNLLWIQGNAESVARQQASGRIFAWYLLSLAAAWLPLLFVLLRRQRRRG